MQTQPKLLPAGAVLKMFGVHWTTLYRWRAKGRLPGATKINGRWYYPETDVQRLIRQGER